MAARRDVVEAIQQELDADVGPDGLGISMADRIAIALGAADLLWRASEPPVPVVQFVECDTCRAKPGAPTLCAGCLHNRQVIAACVQPTLEDKLAVMVWYLTEIRAGRRGADPRGFESYLDDPEIATWLDRMKKANRITNTRFTEKRG